MWYHENMEKERKSELLNRPEIQEFIANRKIKAEDLHLIEKIASFGRRLIAEELHNAFNMPRERSGQQLERLINHTKDETKVELYKAALEFYNKYNWSVSWNLVRVWREKQDYDQQERNSCRCVWWNGPSSCWSYPFNSGC